MNTRAFPELPYGAEVFIGEADDRMDGYVLRLRHCRCLDEVVRARDEVAAHIDELARDHRVVGKLPMADGDVDALFDEIELAVGQYALEFDVREGGAKGA